MVINMELTLLEEDQIKGNNRLEIFDKIGTKAAITDYAIALGGLVASNFFTKGGENQLECRTGYYWTKTCDGDNDARVVNYYGNRSRSVVNRRGGGIRVALPYSEIASIASNEVRGPDGVVQLEAGYLPKKITSKQLQKELERIYDRKKRFFQKDTTLKNISKNYTVDSRNYDEYSEKFDPEQLEEVELTNGKKYTRVIIKPRFNEKMVTFSDGEIYQVGDAVWIEKCPVTWYRDLKTDTVFNKDIIVSGIPFNHERNYTGNFSKTDMYKYLNTHLLKDMELISPQISYDSTNTEKIEDSVTKAKKKNPFDFDFSMVDEEDIIRGALESDVPIYLHGRSSEGKSSRVKQYDPDCEIVYLVSASIDSINGKSVYNQDTGEMIDIPPTWYERLKQKCENEPDKLHIVFFDELANADRSIRKSIFNIILDKEINGKWKLPSNARIVGAGNEIEDSSVAEELPAPLFNRFAHVYIHTSVESWLSWAITDKGEYERLDYKKEELKYKIHPAIYSFIAYRGEDVLRSKYDGKRPNADPRKWELASKILEKTNQPEMIRALVGEEIASEFIGFCSQEVITLDDVLNDDYTDYDLEMDMSQKAATVLALSNVDMENMEKVRNFTIKLGPSSCAQFENLWAHGDANRLEQIELLHMKDAEKGGVRR